jgi:hypothetical protein
MLFKLLRRLSRKRTPNVWQFTDDVRDVMLVRMSWAMSGDLIAAEARRMVLEKHKAAVGAQQAYVRALLNGDLAGGSRDCFDIYQRAVKSNRKRLRRRR